eukprot:1487307-Rhodomonas_salina.3
MNPNMNPNIRRVHVGETLKISAVDLAMAVTGRTLPQCSVMIQHALSSVDHGEKARCLLWDKPVPLARAASNLRAHDR